MKTFKSNSAEETKKIASDLSQEFKNGGIILLSGDLGAGKTTFTQGFAKGLGIKDKILSPTFVVTRIHKVPNSKNVLYHIDLYRFDDTADLNGLGLKEIFDAPENIVLVEWSEKLGNLKPKNFTNIKIQNISEDQRIIEVENY